MIRFRFKPVIFLCLILVFPVWTGTLQAQIYPEAYLEEAVRNNPGLNAQHLAFEAASEQVDVSSSLPDPTLSGGVFTPPMQRLMGNQWFEAGVMQMFPWFGTLQKQGEAAGKMAESAYHQYRESRNRLFFEMTRLWLEIYKIDRQTQLIAGFMEVLKEREDLIYTRYEGGLQRSGLTLDLYRMEIRLSELENQAEKLKETRISLVRSFNILAGRAEGAELDIPSGLPETPSMQGETAGSADFDGNPVIQMARSRSDAAGIQAEVSRLRTRPVLGIGLQYSYFEPGSAAMGQMDGGHMVMPMVSVSLPVFGKKNQAIRQQSRLIASMEGMREKDQLNAMQSRWAILEAALQNLQRDHLFFQNQMEITRRAWDLVLVGYAGGNEGYDELLRIEDQILDLEWRLIETNVDHHLKQAEMDLLQAKNIFE